MNERIFYCTGKEEIEEIIEMIEECSADTIFFQFPRNSILFQQKTNLQKIVKIIDTEKKNVIMVTQNARARKEMQSIGLHSIAVIADINTKPYIPSNSSILSKISLYPIDPEKFRTKKVEKDSSEVIQKISKPSLHSLFLLAVIALIFFIFVVYMVIPSATISIIPERKEVEMHLNTELYSQQDFTEKDVWKSNNGMFMIPVNVTYEYKGIYTNVFKQVEGENAKGLIEIINKTKESILLKEGTRVQTKEGILFTLPTGIRIEAGDKKAIRVVASTEDVYRKVQADRANIPKGVILTLPGLSTSLQNQIYAVSTEDFSGGRGTWRYSVNKKNIEEAKKEWEEEAKKKLNEEINKKIEELKKQFPEDEIVLITPFDQYITIETKNINFDVPEESLIGTSVPSFSGSITLFSKVYAYKLSDMKDIIVSKFERLAPDGMKLSSINTDILVISLQNVNTEKNKMKVSVSTRGIYEYVVEPNSEKSLQFIQAAKMAIIGKNREEARIILLNNFKEVSDVEISLFPFWKRSLPLLPEKIDFEIIK